MSDTPSEDECAAQGLHQCVSSAPLPSSNVFLENTMHLMCFAISLDFFHLIRTETRSGNVGD